MGRLNVSLCGIELDNPIIPSSGTFGYGYEYSDLYDINVLGTFSFKGTTKDQRFGNPTPRIAECYSGMINAVGLQNPGVHDVIKNELPKLKACFNKPVMANVSGFAVEDYAEIVSDYECFESLNIPKHHPARDMQDTYYLENGQLLKSQTSAAQNAIYKKYKDALVNDGVPIKAIFPGRCFRNEATDACHENTFFQMEGVMVDKDISISNLIYFMKTMLSEVFQKDIKVRLRPGFFPFTEPSAEVDVQCIMCEGKGCRTCSGTGWSRRDRSQPRRQERSSCRGAAWPASERQRSHGKKASFS